MKKIPQLQILALVRPLRISPAYLQAHVLDEWNWHPKHKSDRTNGFSLTELLVMIAIIAILAALLLPALSRANAVAKSTVCKSNLYQIGVGLRLYVDECGKYPLEFDSTSNIGWSEGLGHYYGDKLFHCPWPENDGASDDPELGHPYVYNARAGLSSTGLGLGKMSLETPNVAVPDSSVQAPSDMIAIGEDCGFRFCPAGFGWPGCVGHYRPHLDRFNAVFCDAHVESSIKQTVAALIDESHAKRWFRDNQPHQETWAHP
jgi:prepilin-type N-terminal cleavage/methylation domain-containing protein/prepilin-type processing-associated H-X9-DG protein